MASIIYMPTYPHCPVIISKHIAYIIFIKWNSLITQLYFATFKVWTILYPAKCQHYAETYFGMLCKAIATANLDPH
jgi:hypothetical protein